MNIEMLKHFTLLILIIQMHQCLKIKIINNFIKFNENKNLIT